MGHKNIKPDDLFSYILENTVHILDRKTGLSDPVFTCYEAVPCIRNGKTEINIDTGSVSVIETNTLSNICKIYPNSPDAADMLTIRCDGLFLKISDFEWIGREQDIRVKKHKVYGLCCFFSFERIEQ
jgi:hypothetical protein